MKKALSLLLALVLCLSLCACGTEEENESKGIVLTPENFDTYVRTEKRFTRDNYAKDVYLYLATTGASTNYDYNNVSVTYKVSQNWTCSGTIMDDSSPASEWETWSHDELLEFTITVKTDISGYGEASENYSIDVVRCSELHKDGYSSDGWESDNYKYPDMRDFTWEIVSVTGTLTPVG